MPSSSSNLPADNPPTRPQASPHASSSRSRTTSIRRPHELTHHPSYSPDNASSYDFAAASSSAVVRRPRRGMTFEEVRNGRILDPEEGSAKFEGIALDEKAIKKLSRKVRPYYEHLVTLQEHYTEVDQILSGSIPYTVATSFHAATYHNRPHKQQKTYTQLLKDLEDETYTSDDEDGSAEEWMRRGSTWRVRTKRDGSGRSGERDEGGKVGDEEIGEETGILSGQEREERRDRIAQIALYVNTAVNIVLVVAKAFAVLYSASISLTASLVDSVLDLLSTFIILGTSWAIGMKGDSHIYPAGKKRFEPLGVLIFSVAMIASFIQVFIESFQRARAPSDESPVDLSKVGIATMLATIGVKAILWVWCSRIPSSGVQALAQDAENDVFFNIMSLAFPFLGKIFQWRLLDPIGGMVLSTYIIVEWVKTLLENFRNLSGRSASKDQVTRVLYLVTRFNPVLEIADVECYHIGDDLIVEIDVILPRSSTLHFAHDVGETIQCCLESLDGILRAYVHVDYSSSNPAQHTARIAGVTPSKHSPNGLTPSKSRTSNSDRSGSDSGSNSGTIRNGSYGSVSDRTTS